MVPLETTDRLSKRPRFSGLSTINIRYRLMIFTINTLFSIFQAHSVWKNVYSEWPSTDSGNYIIEDLQIPELDMLLASKEKGQTLAFSYLMNNKWDEKFHKFELHKTNCIVKNPVDGVTLTSTHSSLYFKVFFLNTKIFLEVLVFRDHYYCNLI